MDLGESDKMIGRLFAEVTGLFEDGAGLAIEGQAPKGKDLDDLLGQLSSYASDIFKMLAAIEVLRRRAD